MLSPLLLLGCGKLLLSGKMLGVQMTMDSTLIDLGFISSGLLTVEFSVELLWCTDDVSDVWVSSFCRTAFAVSYQHAYVPFLPEDTSLGVAGRPSSSEDL